MYEIALSGVVLLLTSAVTGIPLGDRLEVFFTEWLIFISRTSPVQTEFSVGRKCRPLLF